MKNCGQPIIKIFHFKVKAIFAANHECGILKSALFYRKQTLVSSFFCPELEDYGFSYLMLGQKLWSTFIKMAKNEGNFLFFMVFLPIKKSTLFSYLV